MATDPQDITLTDEQRRLLAEKAEETGRPWAELLEELFARLATSRSTQKTGRSLYDALNERGMIGTLNGPGDLSTNPKHMEGFGDGTGST